METIERVLIFMYSKKTLMMLKGNIETSLTTSELRCYINIFRQNEWNVAKSD